MKTPALLLSIFVMVQCAMAQAIFTPEIPALNIAHCAFDHIQVIDARKNKEDIGYLKKGAFNSKVVLQPEGSMEQMLTDLGTGIIQSAQQKGDATLLIIVRDFVIEDDPSKTTRGLGTCYARMLFYLGKDGAFTKEKPCEGFFETGNNLDVTNLVLKLASGVLGQWMEEASNPNAYADIAPRSLANILDNIKNEYSSFPVYQTPPHKGIYYTLEQFLNNTPADTLFIKKSHHTDYGTVTYFFTTKDGKKKEKNLDRIACYAVYDGSNWYKKTDRGIYSMNFTDGDFYYNEAGKGKVVRGAGLMFGLAGAVTEAILYTDKDMTGKALVLYKVRLDPFNNSCHFIHRIL